MHNGEQVGVDSTAPFLMEFGRMHADPSMGPGAADYDGDSVYERKYLTDTEVGGKFSTIASVLTGNKAVDQATLARFQKEDPLAYQVLKTQVEFTDKMCGNWRLGNDSRVKEAFWPEFQSAMLGRKDAKTAEE